MPISVVAPWFVRMYRPIPKLRASHFRIDIRHAAAVLANRLEVGQQMRGRDPAVGTVGKRRRQDRFERPGLRHGVEIRDLCSG